VNVQAIGGIVLAVALGWATGSPLNAFALLGTVATTIVVAIYILTNLSNLREGVLGPILVFAA
jgi:hypothetical protein